MDEESKNQPHNNNNVVMSALLGLFNHGHSITWWTRIFAYLITSEQQQMELRFLCRVYSKSLKPPPLWTSYPHSKYSSLADLLERLNQLHDQAKEETTTSSSVSAQVPTILFVKEGEYNEGDSDVDIHLPITIIGAGREHTFVDTKITIYGQKNHGEVVMKEMSVRNSKRHGLNGFGGMNFTLENMNFTECGGDGVKVWKTHGKLINCQVTTSGGSGISCWNGGLVEVFGRKTRVTENCTKKKSDHRGLNANDSTSKIVLHSPLTKELISTKNCGGGNWGGKGMIMTLTQ